MVWISRLCLFYKEPQDLALADKEVCCNKMGREFQSGKQTQMKVKARKRKKGIVHIVLELNRNPKSTLVNLSWNLF